jgi:hypothetical protein
VEARQAVPQQTPSFSIAYPVRDNRGEIEAGRQEKRAGISPFLGNKSHESQKSNEWDRG